MAMSANETARHLLLVDPRVARRSPMRAQLLADGWEVFEAVDRQEALQCPRSISVAVCAAEVVGASGSDMIEALLAEVPELPVIVVGAVAETSQDHSRAFDVVPRGPDAALAVRSSAIRADRRTRILRRNARLRTLLDLVNCELAERRDSA